MANGNGPGYSEAQAEATLRAQIEAAVRAGTITRAQADAAEKNLAQSVAGAANPLTAIAGAPSGNDTTAPKNAVLGAAGLPTSVPNIGSVLDFLKLLGNSNTWIRVAEFAVGAILITVGISKMTGTGGTVKKAAKAAVL